MSIERGPKRKLRVDAERNRQRLLEVAKLAFAEQGLSASLEEIARKAGVGIGTLYRHFPTREVLVDEIYRDQGNRLSAAAEELASRMPPIEALRKWLLLFIESLENKQIMAGVLSCISDGGEEYCALSGEVLVAALDRLLEGAMLSGKPERTVESLDLLCAIAGIATYAEAPAWKSSAERLVRVVMAGLQG